MVYRMKVYVDGGCRRNGYSDAIAAAAAIQPARGGRRYWSRAQQVKGAATNQRAELTAIILGLEMALSRYDDLASYPALNLTLYSDSRYAVDCMTDFVYKWTRNGWINARGERVANRDLIQDAVDLDDRVSQLGRVTYSWIPRSDNELADEHCNEELDKLEYYYDSSSDDSYYY